MAHYVVTITRDSLYDVDAESEDAAIDLALSGEAEEIPGGETTGARADEDRSGVQLMSAEDQLANGNR